MSAVAAAMSGAWLLLAAFWFVKDQGERAAECFAMGMLCALIFVALA